MSGRGKAPQLSDADREAIQAALPTLDMLRALFTSQVLARDSAGVAATAEGGAGAAPPSLTDEELAAEAADFDNDPETDVPGALSPQESVVLVRRLAEMLESRVEAACPPFAAYLRPHLRYALADAESELEHGGKAAFSFRHLLCNGMEALLEVAPQLLMP
jgi:hypothetical protein